MQQQTWGQPTYRFNDAESGCHLSSALMATPGTENKQTNRPNVNSLSSIRMMCLAFAIVLCRSNLFLIWFWTKGGKKYITCHFPPSSFPTSHFVRVTHRLQRRTAYARTWKKEKKNPPNLSLTTLWTVAFQLGYALSYSVITCNDKMLISVLRVVKGVLDGVCPGREGWCRLVSATLESSAICRSRM